MAIKSPFGGTYPDVLLILVTAVVVDGVGVTNDLISRCGNAAKNNRNIIYYNIIY